MAVTEDKLLEMTVEIAKSALYGDVKALDSHYAVGQLIKDIYKALSDINNGNSKQA